MSNMFKLCPTHFSRGGAKIVLGGDSPPLVTSLSITPAPDLDGGGPGPKRGGRPHVWIGYRIFR